MHNFYQSRKATRKCCERAERLCAAQFDDPAAIVVSRVRTNASLRFQTTKILLSGLVWIAAATLAGGGETSDSGQAPVAGPGSIERFQTFLTNRPVIKLLTFKQRATISPSFLTRVAPSVRLKEGWQTNSSKICGAWQPGEYAIWTHAAGALQPQQAWLGFDKGIYWQISGGVVTLCAPDDTTYAPTIAAPLNGFLDVLNCGIPNIEDGSLVWEGSTFRARTRALQHMSGTLHSSNGVPRRIECEVEGHETSYQILYQFKDDTDLPIPNSIEVLAKGQDQQRYEPLVEVAITEVQFSDTPLQRGEVTRYVRPEFKALPAWVMITNGQTVMQTPTGQRIAVSARRHPLLAKYARWIVVASFGLSSAAALCWLLVQKRERQPK